MFDFNNKDNLPLEHITRYSEGLEKAASGIEVTFFLKKMLFFTQIIFYGLLYTSQSIIKMEMSSF